MNPAFGNFTVASMEVAQAFQGSLDGAFPSQYYIAALLERGVRALVYVGDTDFACNWVSCHLVLRIEDEPSFIRLADWKRKDDTQVGVDR